MATPTPDQSHWVKDEFVLNCTSCSTAFSLSVRKHHCRRCGEIFCTQCAGKTARLPRLGYGTTAQRVCESCFSAVSLETLDGNDTNKDDDELSRVESTTIDSLKRLYTAGIKPLEVQFKFGDFYSPLLSDADFSAKPMVLLLGSYSVGKTSFIRYLCQRDFPGQRVGPEPTTDRFTIVCGSDDASGGDSVIPGNALAVAADKPFRTLQGFGASFLDHLECSQTNTRSHGGAASILRSITFVDTPGVLSGEKQRIGRAYDFTGVVEWFAGRCDRILLLFDAHKLDISDEFRAAIGALAGHDDKIRIVLNKADMVDSQQLLRVHGALMWSLGKVIKTPEVCRVYVGSFWDQPLQNVSFKDLFERESRDLVNDLKSLPASAVVRKLNEVVKRARAAKTHALLIEHLRTKLPYFGREKALQGMLDNLEQEYQEIHRKHNVPLGDFPRPSTFRTALRDKAGNDLSQFPPLNQRMIAELNEILSSYLPRLHGAHAKMVNKISGQGAPPQDNPFGQGAGWTVVPDTFAIYENEFQALGPVDGFLQGAKLRETFMATGLDKAQLAAIWELADVDQDGALDKYEFAIAKHLIELLEKDPNARLPNLLPPDLMPPENRK